MAIQEFIWQPAQGSDYDPTKPLPAPSVAPKEIIDIPPVADEGSHQIEIFSSDDPVYGEAVTLRTQQLHTQVYLDCGFITPADLNEKGLFTDEYSLRSTHLFLRNGIETTGVRSIRADSKGGGLLSLPTTKKFEIDSEALCAAAGVEQLSDIKPTDVVEISGLGSRSHGKKDRPPESPAATMTAYARLLRDSVEQGHSLWVMNVEPRFIRYLGGMIGKEQVHVLGPEKEYMGPATLPVAINPQEAVRSILTSDGPLSDLKRAYIREVFSGINDKKIPKDLRALLEEHEVTVTKTPVLERLVANPKTWAYAIILGYSSLRALPAAAVEEFDGNTALLWGIDVATAPSYTWGVMEAFSRKKSLGHRALGATVGSASFAAPYVYFGMMGKEEYPTYVNAAIAGFVGIAVANEVVGRTLRSRKDKVLARQLNSGDFLPEEKQGWSNTALSGVKNVLGLSKAKGPVIPLQRTPQP